MKNLIFFIISLISTIVFSQECKPNREVPQSNGDIVKLYGGNIRSGGFGSNDKSIYALYIAQLNDGSKGTTLIATLYEPVENKKDYDDAVNNFLNENNLKTSTLDITINGIVIHVKANGCSQQPVKILGSIGAYSVTFEGDILKNQIELLQLHDIQRFRLTIGGHPYERVFNKPTDRTQKLKEEFSCVKMENVFEVKRKDASELDLTEVGQVDYSKIIKGKWILQGSNGDIIEFKDGNYIYSKMGVEIASGSYKIASSKLIITTQKGNQINDITMFLKDMIMLKDSKGEETWERIE